MKPARAVAYFLFDAGAPQAVALLRISLALALLMGRLTQLPDTVFFYSDEGVLANQSLSQYQPDHFWSLFHLVGSPAAVMALTAAFMAVLCCVATGLFTGPMTVAMFVFVVSYRWRNPLVANSGDQVAMVAAFWLMFARSGHCWSIDAWRRRRRALPHRRWTGGLALRVLQFQLCFIYGWSVVHKLTDPDWISGNTMFYVAGLVYDWVVPSTGMMDRAWLYKSATWGTLAFEAAFPILAWSRRTRRPMVAAGILFHLGIAIPMGLVFFSLNMIALLLVFWPQDRRPPWDQAPSVGAAPEPAPAG